jgi:hypothetical protein
MDGKFAGTLMDKLEADLAQFRKAFNERILYVQYCLPPSLFLSIFCVQLFPPVARNIRLGTAFLLGYVAPLMICLGCRSYLGS